jgi:hypothetical protein
MIDTAGNPGGRRHRNGDPVKAAVDAGFPYPITRGRLRASLENPLPAIRSNIGRR